MNIYVDLAKRVAVIMFGIILITASVIAATANANDLCKNNGGCEHICAVVNGQAKCSCRKGFELNHDGRTCHDKDLCAVHNGGCDQICTSDHDKDTVTCSCRNGYELEPINKRTCQLKDLCANNNGGCQDECESVNGITRKCSCRNGFALDTDGTSCYDTNMCGTKNGGCLQNCTNIKKGVKCHCFVGFMVNPENEKDCIDIKPYVDGVKTYILQMKVKHNDECINDNGGCDHFCENTLESYKCSCREDYTLGDNGKSCSYWDWYWTLIIIFIIFVILILIIVIWCLCGKFKWLSENICCKFFISWKCCITGLFCKCNKRTEADVTDLYYHEVSLKVAPQQDYKEAVPLTDA